MPTAAAALVTALRAILGVRLFAIIAGESDTAPVHAWVPGQTPLTDPVTIKRLRVGYQAARLIADTESPAVAQAWMEGLNPDLDDQTPAIVLRDSDPEVVGPRVLAAAYPLRRRGTSSPSTTRQHGSLGKSQ